MFCLFLKNSVFVVLLLSINFVFSLNFTCDRSIPTYKSVEQKTTYYLQAFKNIDAIDKLNVDLNYTNAEQIELVDLFSSNSIYSIFKIVLKILLQLSKVVFLLMQTI